MRLNSSLSSDNPAGYKYTRDWNRELGGYRPSKNHTRDRMSLISQGFNLTVALYNQCASKYIYSATDMISFSTI
jgi:hypothetical protein